ncbi:uncharacterized protein [Narcine bancroftii]|uniref:uncharacterized protein n=1 Tax=Narcine bancroftii TaxID=1343680 RepID=UPI0038316AE9
MTFTTKGRNIWKGSDGLSQHGGQSTSVFFSPSLPTTGLGYTCSPSLPITGLGDTWSPSFPTTGLGYSRHHSLPDTPCHWTVAQVTPSLPTHRLLRISPVVHLLSQVTGCPPPSSPATPILTLPPPVPRNHHARLPSNGVTPILTLPPPVPRNHHARHPGNGATPILTLPPPVPRNHHARHPGNGATPTLPPPPYSSATPMQAWSEAGWSQAGKEREQRAHGTVIVLEGQAQISSRGAMTKANCPRPNTGRLESCGESLLSSLSSLRRALLY